MDQPHLVLAVILRTSSLPQIVSENVRLVCMVTLKSVCVSPVIKCARRAQMAKLEINVGLVQTDCSSVSAKLLVNSQNCNLVTYPRYAT